ncbi:MAG TPA: class I SAM-dependent methyltransferase [Candidatus Binataceae bacterium]|nr:class I SAM-dependent methyltransferase [Candidatus Binataceae bacterium]
MATQPSDGVTEVIVSTREGYDRWAEVYDTDGNPLIAIEEPEAARMMGEVRGLTVADIGTGTGRHALRMARDGARVVAIDFSLGMMARARSKPGAERVAFVCADCLTLPLPDSSFHRVISGLVVEHIAALDRYFNELGRICRPDGFIVVTNLHPAMNLQGVRARFNDPATGAKVYPAGRDHLISDFVMAARRTGLVIDEMVERTMTADIVGKAPRAERYVGWPALLAIRLSRAAK